VEPENISDCKIDSLITCATNIVFKLSYLTYLCSFTGTRWS